MILLAFCLQLQDCCWNSCHHVCIPSSSGIHWQWRKEVKRVPAHHLSFHSRVFHSKAQFTFPWPSLAARETVKCNHIHHYLKVPIASSPFPPLLATHRPDYPSSVPPFLPLEPMLCPWSHNFTNDCSCVLWVCVTEQGNLNTPSIPLTLKPTRKAALELYHYQWGHRNHKCNLLSTAQEVNSNIWKQLG